MGPLNKRENIGELSLACEKYHGITVLFPAIDTASQEPVVSFFSLSHYDTKSKS